MSQSPTPKPGAKPLPRRAPHASDKPSPSTEKPKDWTNRRATIVGAVVGLLGIGVAIVLAQPKYVPSTIYQPGEGDRPQKVADLTPDSKMCDAAVRGLLLAFANEIETPDSTAPLDAVSKTKALVDTDLAIVPVQCQKLIDPRSVASDGNLVVGVRSVRYKKGAITATLTIHNQGTGPVSVMFEDRDANVAFTDNRNSTRYRFYNVSGVYNCSYVYCGQNKEHATRIGAGANAIVSVEASQSSMYAYPPTLASLALTLLSAKPDGTLESLSFGFHDVPVGD